MGDLPAFATDTPSDAAARRWGRWIRHFLYATGVVTLLHVTVAVYIPQSRPWLGKTLAPIAEALRFFGLPITKPGFAGTLGSQFYIDQVALANWGVILCTAFTLLQVLRGNLLRPVPLERLMSVRNISRRHAWLLQYASMLFVFVPLIIFCGWSFLDATFGWVVFTPQDWGALESFTVLFVYMTGSVIVPLCLFIGAVIARDLRILFR